MWRGIPNNQIAERPPPPRSRLSPSCITRQRFSVQFVVPAPQRIDERCTPHRNPTFHARRSPSISKGTALAGGACSGRGMRAARYERTGGRAIDTAACMCAGIEEARRQRAIAITHSAGAPSPTAKTPYTSPPTREHRSTAAPRRAPSSRREYLNAW
ncbi:hypothetical protein HYPSUDRAFT_1045421 [Hypholoma sublateritium FD-334 SS-4]|uniref:Uncharacterized protein n=1 Tax=Hypholoma sublateritium (strain FD-334 SS-4) TaxID=945553 RepID=A0A0D2NDB1_HYPSF|nr:hypothetical protein HYPSUDRAFT_1045421 [Hypholoma sublateritium FD-334 SS-4]